MQIDLKHAEGRQAVLVRAFGWARAPALCVCFVVFSLPFLLLLLLFLLPLLLLLLLLTATTRSVYPSFLFFFSSFFLLLLLLPLPLLTAPNRYGVSSARTFAHTPMC